MKSRRDVLKFGAMAVSSLALPGACTRYTPRSEASLRPREVRNALVLWYSQTDNTRRIGRLIAAVWQNHGIETQACDIRDFNPNQLSGFDLLAMGCPVNHYDAPAFVQTWLGKISNLQGMPAAAFVTHGIPASNQHNTACTLLDLMAEKGGVPVGLETFGNLGTYPPAWAFSPEKALAGSGHPNPETFARGRSYAEMLLERVREGRPFSYGHEFGFGDVKKNLSPIWFSKLITDKHFIDLQRCIGCGTCAGKCPTGAIDPSAGTVDKSICVDCMGCINNCPAQAVKIIYWGKELIGYREFLKQQRIEILEPAELRSASEKSGNLILPDPGLTAER